MQYESKLDREQLIDLATKSYFGNVDDKNLDAVLTCFHDEALFTIQTDRTTHSGSGEIRCMFQDFFDDYEKIIHKNFVCTADEENGRICAVFDVEVTDLEGNVTRMRNTNFWRVRGDKFQEVYVYMSGANVLK
ncbi:MAG TPA: nuclear transport factor 2 family protein [Sneathiellales bacterium]|jgi:ketosteroid isomerase-like protein|nr:nuclear transport factor 2 family protein [Sneathiellales bacterium]